MTIIAFNTSQQNLMNEYAKANPDAQTFTKKALTDFAVANSHKPRHRLEHYQESSKTCLRCLSDGRD